MSVEPVEILRYARDVVLEDESKWCNGGIDDAEGPLFSAFRHDKARGSEDGVIRGERFCTLWAIVRARWELTGRFGLFGGFGDGEFRELLDGLCGTSTWAWNDTDGRTFSDVIDLFDKAIKKLEER